MYWMEEEPTEEQLAEFERAQVRGQDMANRMQRLFAEELTPDQLLVVFNILRAITSSQDPLRLAEWYEGMVHGIRYTRDLRLGEQTMEDAEAIDGV